MGVPEVRPQGGAVHTTTLVDVTEGDRGVPLTSAGNALPRPEDSYTQGAAHPESNGTSPLRSILWAFAGEAPPVGDQKWSGSKTAHGTLIDSLDIYFADPVLNRDGALKEALKNIRNADSVEVALKSITIVYQRLKVVSGTDTFNMRAVQIGLANLKGIHGAHLLMAGRAAEAAEYFRATRLLYRRHAPSDAIVALTEMNLADARILAGDYARAAENIERAVLNFRTSPSPHLSGAEIAKLEGLLPRLHGGRESAEAAHAALNRIRGAAFSVHMDERIWGPVAYDASAKLFEVAAAVASDIYESNPKFFEGKGADPRVVIADLMQAQALATKERARHRSLDDHVGLKAALVGRAENLFREAVSLYPDPVLKAYAQARLAEVQGQIRSSRQDYVASARSWFEAAALLQGAKAGPAARISPGRDVSEVAARWVGRGIGTLEMPFGSERHDDKSWQGIISAEVKVVNEAMKAADSVAKTLEEKGNASALGDVRKKQTGLAILMDRHNVVQRNLELLASSRETESLKIARTLARDHARKLARGLRMGKVSVAVAQETARVFDVLARTTGSDSDAELHYIFCGAIVDQRGKVARRAPLSVRGTDTSAGNLETPLSPVLDEAGIKRPDGNALGLDDIKRLEKLLVRRAAMEGVGDTDYLRLCQRVRLVIRLVRAQKLNLGFGPQKLVSYLSDPSPGSHLDVLQIRLGSHANFVRDGNGNAIGGKRASEGRFIGFRAIRNELGVGEHTPGQHRHEAPRFSFGRRALGGAIGMPAGIVVSTAADKMLDGFGRPIKWQREIANFTASLPAGAISGAAVSLPLAKGLGLANAIKNPGMRMGAGFASRGAAAFANVFLMCLFSDVLADGRLDITAAEAARQGKYIMMASGATSAVFTGAALARNAVKARRARLSAFEIAVRMRRTKLIASLVGTAASGGAGLAVRTLVFETVFRSAENTLNLVLINLFARSDSAKVMAEAKSRLADAMAGFVVMRENGASFSELKKQTEDILERAGECVGIAAARPYISVDVAREIEMGHVEESRNSVARRALGLKAEEESHYSPMNLPELGGLNFLRLEDAEISRATSEGLRTIAEGRRAEKIREELDAERMAFAGLDEEARGLERGFGEEKRAIRAEFESRRRPSGHDTTGITAVRHRSHISGELFNSRPREDAPLYYLADRRRVAETITLSDDPDVLMEEVSGFIEDQAIRASEQFLSEV